MSRFVVQLAVLLVLVFGINGLLNLALPFGWGDGRIAAKLEQWQEDRAEIDTLLIGSSWTYRQIAPEVFDPAVGNIRSFNFGVDGVHQPLSGRILEYLVEEEHYRPRLVLLELARFTSAVDPELDHTREAKFWRTPKLTYSMIRVLADRPDKSLPQKAFQAVRLSLIQMEAWLNVGHGVGLLEWATGTEPQRAILGPRGDGFYSVDQQSRETAGTAFTNQFLENPEAEDILERIRSQCGEALAASPQSMNGEALRVLERSLASAEAHGFRLIFWVPPRLCSRYAQILPLFERLPRENLITELADPALYPELYRLDESADRIHFNERGAHRFSRLLAEEVRKRWAGGD